MAINNDANPPVSIPGGIGNLSPTGADSENISFGNGVNENFDWFSVSDGKALPISAQTQFGDTSSMDEMVSAMLGHLGLA